jgi:hypothetical protein
MTTTDRAILAVRSLRIHHHAGTPLLDGWTSPPAAAN